MAENGGDGKGEMPPRARQANGEKYCDCSSLYSCVYIEAMTGRNVKICSSKLTTCGVAADGEIVGLEFVDDSGSTVTVELPFNQAAAVVMTLPHLLARSLRRRTGNDKARYVFGLEEWFIEDTDGQDCLIVTLKTTDGFEVSFGIPLEACRTLGWSLQHEAEKIVDAREVDEEATASGRTGLN
jgi:hypothetical protein